MRYPDIAELRCGYYPLAGMAHMHLKMIFRTIFLWILPAPILSCETKQDVPWPGLTNREPQSAVTFQLKFHIWGAVQGINPGRYTIHSPEMDHGCS